MYYAQINQDGIAFAVTETAGEINQPDMIALASFDTSVIGKKWVNGVWEVVPAPPEPRHITVGALYDRFGAEKYNILASTDPVVQALVKDVSVRKFIDLDRPDLLQGLQLVQSKGFAIDPQAIVSAPIQSDERP